MIASHRMGILKTRISCSFLFYVKTVGRKEEKNLFTNCFGQIFFHGKKSNEREWVRIASEHDSCTNLCSLTTFFYQEKKHKTTQKCSAGSP